MQIFRNLPEQVETRRSAIESGRFHSRSAPHARKEQGLNSKADPVLLGVTMILLALGALMVFSTTAIASKELYGDSMTLIRKHLLHMVLGLFVFAFFASFNPRRLERISLALLFLAFALLMLVLVPGLGDSAGGAQRWMQLGPLRVQPGELVKLLVVLYFAGYIQRHHERMFEFVAGALFPFALVSSLAVLLLLQPDFGSTVVLLMVVCSQLTVASRFVHLGLIGVAGAGAAALLITYSPYRMRRLTAFLDPFLDPAESGYQLIQSLIAVGSGGWLGVGLGGGQQKLFYLPAAHTDFIFAVIAEELGFLGAAVVVCLFLTFLLRGVRIARLLADDFYASSLAIGCTLLIVMPAFLNMGVVLGLLPTKGMVLPFLAYGGTALLVHCAAAGILLGLSKGLSTGSSLGHSRER